MCTHTHTHTHTHSLTCALTHTHTLTLTHTHMKTHAQVFFGPISLIYIQKFSLCFKDNTHCFFITKNYQLMPFREIIAFQCENFIKHSMQSFVMLQQTVYSIQYTVYSTQYTVYSIQYTVHSIQYTVYTTATAP